MHRRYGVANSEILLSDVGFAHDVALSIMKGEQHLLAASGSELRHRVKRDAEPWGAWQSIPRPSGYVDRVCATYSGTVLHVAYISDRRQEYHSFLRPDGTWASWVDVESRAGERGFLDDCALSSRVETSP